MTTIRFPLSNSTTGDYVCRYCGARSVNQEDHALHESYCAYRPPRIPECDLVVCVACGKHMTRLSELPRKGPDGWRCYDCRLPEPPRTRRVPVVTYHDRPYWALTINQRRREQMYADEHREWLEERDKGVIVE